MKQIILCLAVGLSGWQPETAQAAFEKAEAAILKAPALSVSFRYTLKTSTEGRAVEGKGEGGVQMSGAAKLRLRNKVEFGSSLIVEREIVSDGEKVWTRNQGPMAEGGGRTATVDAPKDVADRARLLFARGGAWGLFLFERRWHEKAELPMAKRVTVGGFKDAGKEKVGEVEARVIECTLTLVKTSEPRYDGKPWQCRVWLHPETGLPLRRRLTFEDAESSATVEEEYATFDLDAKFDDKTFRIPESK